MESITIKGNTKIGEARTFNVPPVKTCKPTRWCLTGLNGKPACYAQRGRHHNPRVKKSMDERFKVSKRSDFVEKVVDELSRKRKVQYFRIHAAGDFYDEAYVRKWIAICKALPHIKFWAATRRTDLKKAIRELDALPNVIVRESLDPSKQNPSMGLKLAVIYGVPAGKGAFVCPCDDDTKIADGCEDCGYHCWNKRSSVQFHFH